MTSGDWRLTNQQKYLAGVTLQRKRYTKYSESWDHDHCEFCTVEFAESDDGHETILHEGYATLDDYYWICHACFSDFREAFQWKIAKV